MEKCSEYEMYLIKLGELEHKFQIHMVYRFWFMTFLAMLVKTVKTILHELNEHEGRLKWENFLLETCLLLNELVAVKISKCQV